MLVTDNTHDDTDVAAQCVVGIIESCIDSSDIYSKLTQNGTSTVSGLGGNYYKLDGTPEYVLGRRIPIPEELSMQLKNMRSQFSMGLFTDISRAWVVIDHNIFMWNYETNEDLAYFDAVQHTVFKIALVKLKPGIFSSEFNYGLVVGTVADITLYPMTVDSEADKLSIDPLRYFKVVLDNNTINDIVSTNEGRVFFTADDKLFEFVYESQKGWFGLREEKTCRLVNQSYTLLSSLLPFFGSGSEDLEQIAIDKSRHLLYCLGKSGSIQVYDLGADGQQCKHACGLQSGHIMTQANQLTQYGQEGNSFSSIVSICALDATQSNQLNLIAVTAKGVRIYFSVLERSLKSTPQHQHITGTTALSQLEARPQILRVSHVRFTPGAVAQSLSREDKHGVSVAYADQGRCVMATVNPQAVVALSDLHFPNTGLLKETRTDLEVSGYVWDISPVVEQRLPMPITDVNYVPRVLPHSYYRQSVEGKSKLIVCSNEFIYEFVQLTPVESLCRALEDSGSDGRDVAEMLRDFGQTELLVMALHILTSDCPRKERIKNKASALFYSLKDTPRMAENMDRSMADVEWGRDDSISHWKYKIPSPLQASTPRLANNLMSPRQRVSPGMFSPGVYSPALNISYSGTGSHDTRFNGTHRHDALYFYFSRLVLPIWNHSICNIKNGALNTTLSTEQLEWLSSELRKLSAVMEKYRLLPSVEPQFANSAAIRVQTEATNLERISLQNLRNLVQLTAETLSLWAIANSFDLRAISAGIGANVLTSMSSRAFHQLLGKNSHFSGDLIRAMITFFLGDEAGTVRLSERLRKECPLLYSADDACVTNAMELLNKAEAAAPGPIRRRYVESACQMFYQSITKVDLPTVCSLLMKLSGYEHVIDLCILRAEKDDPRKLAYIAYNCDMSRAAADDRDMVAASERRRSAYSVMTDIINQLDEGASVNSATAADNSLNRDLMVSRIIQSDDELAHAALFRWMLEKRKTSLILHSKSPYVEQFITRELSAGRGNAHVLMDMLWQWYEKSGNYEKAATLLSKLADDENPTIGLDQRFAYLSHAIICAQSGDDIKTRSRIEDLKDKNEVAQIQIAIKDILTTHHNQTPMLRDAVKYLDGPIQSLQSLLMDYAIPFNLHKIQLQIFHCATFYDEVKIANVWENLIDAELAKGGDPAEGVRCTIQDIGSMFGRNKYFPIEYILQRLLAKGAGADGKGVVIKPSFFVILVRDLPSYTINEFSKLLLAEYRQGDPFWLENSSGQRYMIEIGLSLAEFILEDPHRRSDLLVNDCETLLSAFQLDVRDVAAAPTLRPYSHRLDQMLILLQQASH